MENYHHRYGVRHGWHGQYIRFRENDQSAEIRKSVRAGSLVRKYSAVERVRGR